MESVPDWSALVHDVLVEIAIGMPSVEDFMTFRAVCTSWRAAASMDKFVAELAAVGKSWKPRVPRLMVAEKKDSDKREFYSLSEGKISMTLTLPQAKGKRCIGVRFGWLLTVTRSGDVALLNPYSRAQSQLPNFRNFPVPPGYVEDYHPCENYYPECIYILGAVLSANPSDTSEFLLFVIAGFSLGFWRPGDENWMRIESHSTFASITLYSQKLYATDYAGYIWVWDPSGADPTAAMQVVFRVDGRFINCRTPYLVESSDGELLLISRNGCHFQDDERNYGATYFEVIRLDVMKRKWEKITSLYKDAIFVGLNAGFSIATVASAFPDAIIKPNCIYFTDDCIEAWDYFANDDPIEAWDEGKGGGKDMGIYNVEDQSIERFDFESRSFICPPLWIPP